MFINPEYQRSNYYAYLVWVVEYSGLKGGEYIEDRNVEGCTPLIQVLVRGEMSYELCLYLDVFEKCSSIS